MPVIPIGRRPGPGILQRALVAESVSVAYLEYERFRTEVTNLIEASSFPRTNADKERIYGRLREHLRRFTELHAVNIHEAQQRQNSRRSYEVWPRH